MKQFFRSPLGMLLTGTAALLVVSPKARETARQLAVRGTSTVLDAIDQLRESVSTGNISVQTSDKMMNAETHTKPPQPSNGNISSQITQEEEPSTDPNYHEFLELLRNANIQPPSEDNIKNVISDEKFKEALHMAKHQTGS